MEGREGGEEGSGGWKEGTRRKNQSDAEAGKWTDELRLPELLLSLCTKRLIKSEKEGEKNK